MASLTTSSSNSISNTIMDSLFPTMGTQPSAHNVIWMESERLFKLNEYVSARGHRYITGLRFSNNLAVVVKYSFWNTWQYLDNIEVYRFEGYELKLLDSKKFEKTFYSSELIHQEVSEIVGKAIKAAARVNNSEINVDVQMLEKMVTDTERSFVNGEYPPMTSTLRKLIDTKSSERIE